MSYKKLGKTPTRVMFLISLKNFFYPLFLILGVFLTSFLGLTDPIYLSNKG